MANFSSRVFGSNIPPKVRNKLRARQALAENHNTDPLSSVILKDVDEAGNEIINKSLNLTSELGEKNFSGGNFGESLFELGSRTPWVRMWTGIEFYYFEDEKSTLTTEKINVVQDVTEYKHSIKDGGVISSKTTKQVVEKERDVKKIKNKQVVPIKNTVFQLGNNEYNSKNPASDIFGSRNNFVNQELLGKVSDVVDTISDRFIYKEGLNNEFMKPGAGITSVTSETDGPLGAIKRTTVNFVVHNFHDHENIYQRYFLKPGALLVVDFGWDTSLIYNPTDMTKKGAKFVDGLLGDGGVVEQSKGDLEVVIGYVTDFTSTVNDVGSFDCSVQITSATDGLLDKSITDSNGIKNKFVNGIVPYLVNKASYLNRGNYQFLRKNWADNKETLENSQNFAKKFASAAFGSYGGDINIGDRSKEVGIYFQNYDEENDSINQVDGNLYVTWGFFEDEMLNSELKLKYDDDSEFGAEFNSIHTFVKYDSNLVDRQNVPSQFTDSKNVLKFLYPSSWDDTYNQKIIEEKKILVERIGDAQTITELDKRNKRIPLREIFIDVDVIKEAFSTENNVNGAINNILSVLNENSYGVFNLGLSVSSQDHSTLSVIDRDISNVEDKYDDIMIFKPNSKGSMVSEFNLNYTTPKNGIQTMAALQGTGVEQPVDIVDLDDHQYQALRMLNGMSAGDINKSLGIRNIPILDNNYVEKEQALYRYEYNFEVPDVNLLFGSNETTSVKSEYESIFSELPEDVQTELEQEYNGLNDYELDIGEEKDEDIEESAQDDGIDEGVDYVSNIEEYFGRKCLKSIIKDETRGVLIPYDLDITIYGISSILPGDIFTVDYLPSYYRDRVYFQTTKVTHNLDNTKWTTKLDSQMWYRPSQKTKNLSLYKGVNKKTFLHPNYFNKKLPSPLKKIFKNFDVTTKGNNNILVLTGMVKSTNKSGWGIDVSGNFSNSDKQVNKGFINNYFISGYASSQKVTNAHYTGAELRDLSTFFPGQLTPNETYNIVIFSGGALVFEKWDPKYVITIDSILRDALGNSNVKQSNISYRFNVDGENPCDVCGEFYNTQGIDDMTDVQQRQYCQETLGQNKYCEYTDRIWPLSNTCEPITYNCP